MWEVQKSGCDGYLPRQRKSISITAGQRRSHAFSERDATELLPRGITCRAQQQPPIHQMPTLQVRRNVFEKLVCVAWAKKKQISAPLCPCLLPRLKTQNLNHVRCEHVSRCNYSPYFLLLFNSPHGHLLLLCMALCCLSSAVETAFVLEKYSLPFVFIWQFGCTSELTHRNS